MLSQPLHLLSHTQRLMLEWSEKIRLSLQATMAAKVCIPKYEKYHFQYPPLPLKIMLVLYIFKVEPLSAFSCLHFKTHLLLALKPCSPY
jgi:hypothetical protein